MRIHRKHLGSAVGGLCLLGLMGCASNNCVEERSRPLVCATWPGPREYWLDGLHLVISPDFEAYLRFGDDATRSVMLGDRAKMYAMTCSVIAATIAEAKDQEMSSALEYLNQITLQITMRSYAISGCVPVVCERVQYERENGGREARSIAAKWLKNGFINVSSWPDKPGVGSHVSLSPKELAQIRRALGE
jgi:hypothetical protein